MQQPVFLKVFHSGQLVANRQFLSDQISIGSNTDGPTLVLSDPSVYSWHVLIEKRGNDYHISDLGSPTGTFVNSHQIVESVLKHGDQIKVGNFTIHFFINVPFAQPGGQKIQNPKQKTAEPLPGLKQNVPSSPTVPPSSAPSVPPKVAPVSPSPEVAPLGSGATPAPPSYAPAPTPPRVAPASPPLPKVAPVSPSPEVAPLGSGATPAPPSYAPAPTPPRVAPASPPLPRVTPVPPKVAPAFPPSPVEPLQKQESVVQPESELSLPGLNRTDEVVIRPLKKQKQETVKETETGASSLPKTEIIPPSVVRRSAGDMGQAPEVPEVQTQTRAPEVPEVQTQTRAPEAQTQTHAHVHEVPEVQTQTRAPEAPAPEAPVPEPQTQAPASEAPEAQTQTHAHVHAPEASAHEQRSKVLPSHSSTEGFNQESPFYEQHLLDEQPKQTEQQSIVTVEKSRYGTYAPKSRISNLDKSIPIGSGPIVEVTVAWKERILFMHHFKDIGQTVTLGSDSKATIFCPNLLGKASYNLLKTGQGACVYLSDGVKVSVIDRKGVKHPFEKLVEKGLITTQGSGQQALSLNQNQLIRMDFSSSLVVYVRYSNREQKATLAGLFGFNFSEMMGLMMSFFFMSLLFFYLAVFSPQFLGDTEELEEGEIKKATIEFKKKRVVKLKMAQKNRKKKTRLSIPQNQKVQKKRKKVGIKKRGSEGRLGQVAAKPKAKSKKKTITSARPGGSVTTKKRGAGPKSPRPDPTKIGLLGVFGKKGAQKQLDKAYSGTGELAGLAEQATGYAGQEDSYTGEGIGTKFKETGAGGKGTNLIGVSAGIKTKGRGGGARGYGTGGSLGRRGMVQLELGTSDWEVEGGVDKNAILRVIRRNKYQLESCYEFALQKRPDMEGKVLVQWNIVNERVRGVKVKSNTTRDSALARCLMSRLRNFRFTGTGLKKGQIGEVTIPFVVTKK